ncbi:MAG: GreA/GreB family elongation factor [Phycisphaerae bacterium]|nr:GreA/GreB family elongation factor [Phycisphaerae bacterium]
MSYILKKEKIKVTEFDAERLEILIITANDSKSNIKIWIEKLQSLLQTAVVVPSEIIEPDRVTMNSKIKLQDVKSLEEMIFTIVFPMTALTTFKQSSEEFNISVLTPMGLLVLGRSAGDNLGGRVKIAEILYQPEAQGDYNL